MTVTERVPSFPPLSFSRLTVTTVTVADGGNDCFQLPTAAALPLLRLQLSSIFLSLTLLNRCLALGCVGLVGSILEKFDLQIEVF
jgi:hypothetical protein